MIKGDFEFIIASMIDRENLTCEMNYKNELLAEISQETNQLMIELYPPENKKRWEIPLQEFQNALAEGKDFLLNYEFNPRELPFS